jgi:hypothetical protein
MELVAREIKGCYTVVEDSICESLYGCVWSTARSELIWKTILFRLIVPVLRDSIREYETK